MASNSSIITGKLQGMLGKELVFRSWAGKTIVAKAPGARDDDPTLAQLKIRETFLTGSRYARSIIQNPEMAEAYARTLKPRQNTYSRALQDYINPPVVGSITTRNYTGQVGDVITIRATDDFRVTAVLVEIYAADGSLLEKGNAVVTTSGIDWTYSSTVVNSALTGSSIKAIAIDVPGNEGFLTVQL